MGKLPASPPLRGGDGRGGCERDESSPERGAGEGSWVAESLSWLGRSVTVVASGAGPLGQTFAADGHSAQDGIGSREHVRIANAHDVDAESTEVLVAALILLTPRLVKGPIDLDREPKLGTVEVHDVAGDDMLTSELPSSEATPSQSLPKCSLAVRGGLPHRAGAAELVLASARRDERPRTEPRTSPHARPSASAVKALLVPDAPTATLVRATRRGRSPTPFPRPAGEGAGMGAACRQCSPQAMSPVLRAE